MLMIPIKRALHMSIEKNNIYSNMLNKYKKDDLHMLTVKYENIKKVFSKDLEDIMIQVKIDGELCALVKDNRGVRLYSRNGRIRTGTPLTEEAEKIDGEFVIIGELYVISESGGPQTYSLSMSTLRNPLSLNDEKRFRFSAFDIVERNNGPYVERYEERFKELSEELSKYNLDMIHLAPYKVGTVKDIYALWDEYVNNGWEGLVVHTVNDVYKIKKFFPIDLIVVGVTRNTGHENQMGALQTAFMTGDNTYVLSSKVGTGLTYNERINWLEWAVANEVPGPDDNIVWVNPKKEPRIVEVRVEEFLGKELQVIKFDGKQIVDFSTQQTVTLRKPVYVRLREDKEPDTKELGFDQVPVWDIDKKRVVRSGIRTPIIASYPTHPNTVIFPENEYYPHDIREEDIYRYYRSVEDKILPLIKGVDLMVTIRTDAGDVIRKNDPSDSHLSVDTIDDFDKKINTGRTIEIHRILRDKEKFAYVDIDPRPGVKFDDTKKLTAVVADAISKIDHPEIKIYSTGHRGFHIYAYFEHEIDVNAMREQLTTLIEQEVIPKFNKAMLDLPKHKDETRIDFTTYHPGGSIRIPYSLHKNTGLAAMEVPRDKLATFTPEQAKINKLTRIGFVIIDTDREKKAIGFDFDNTIFMVEGDDYYNGKINPGILDLINDAKAAGNDIVIFTARVYSHPEDIEFIADVLDKAGIPWDEITYEKKPYMDSFIDDKAVNVDEALSNVEYGSPQNTLQITELPGIDTIYKDMLGLPGIKQFKLKTKGNPPTGVSKAQFPRVTKNFLRYRQFSPSLCTKGTFVMKNTANGGRLVLCKRKDTGKFAVQSKMVHKKNK